MIAGFYGRLACLCLASFFLVHTAVGGVVLLFVPAALRRAKTMGARAAAGLLFSLRLLPFVVASFVVAGLCVPSYLSFEPRGGTEPLGAVCVIAAALGLLLWALAGTRVAAALAATIAFGRRLAKGGRELQISGQAAPVVIVDAQVPLLALSGVVRPTLFLSRGVFESLAPEELKAALRHEAAHRNSRDNLKRLALLLAPEIVPFARCFTALENNWARFGEWAADDEATRGDEQSALWLASALVRVARMGRGPKPELAFSLTACGCGLEARVERLLHNQSLRAEIRSGSDAARKNGLLVAGAVMTALLLMPGALAFVHELLERLIG